MWLFWRPRDLFSLDELRGLTDKLQKVQLLTEANKDFVIEALRSISALMTYGDQHDPSFLDFFMEKDMIGEFVRILGISRTPEVALQLLKTMNIMMQNLKNDYAIKYILGSEHTAYLITYQFDFQNDEVLSLYICFLRAIGGKLNEQTISLLVKTQNDEIVSFPLYVEALKFAFHEDTMVRIAVRQLSLNVYHVGDERVNRFVSKEPLSEFFSDLVIDFQKQCIDFDKLVDQSVRHPESTSSVLVAVERIEETLYYFSDVISSGVPDVGKLLTDNILKLLVFPMLVRSLESHSNDIKISTTTALYLLCCILHIYKSKNLASSVAAILISAVECPGTLYGGVANGVQPSYDVDESKLFTSESSLSASDLPFSPSKNSCQPGTSIRELVLSYVASGDNSKVLGALCFIATLLQTKELDESMLDVIGILPRRKQQKKLLLKNLVGEDAAESQLFSAGNHINRANSSSELDNYLKYLEVQYGLCFHQRGNPKLNRSQVLDTLIGLFGRFDLSAEICWVGGWLFRQLLPQGDDELTVHQLRKLKDSHKTSADKLLEEAKGSWCDILLNVITIAWRNCRKAIEASSPPKDQKSIILPLESPPGGGSSVALGERMFERVKLFVLQHQILVFCNGGNISDHPLTNEQPNANTQEAVASPSPSTSLPKPGAEVDLGKAIPCRIAFERGKECHFLFLAVSKATSGCVMLLEESPLNNQQGIVRISAPLAGTDPKIDERHPKWLHLRIRPPTPPSMDPVKVTNLGKGKAKLMVDGRWTLAFSSDEDCKAARSMMLEEMRLQHSAVEGRLIPVLNELSDNFQKLHSIAEHIESNHFTMEDKEYVHPITKGEELCAADRQSDHPAVQDMEPRHAAAENMESYDLTAEETEHCHLAARETESRHEDTSSKDTESSQYSTEDTELRSLVLQDKDATAEDVSADNSESYNLTSTGTVFRNTTAEHPQRCHHHYAEDTSAKDSKVGTSSTEDANARNAGIRTEDAKPTDAEYSGSCNPIAEDAVRHHPNAEDATEPCCPSSEEANAEDPTVGDTNLHALTVDSTEEYDKAEDTRAYHPTTGDSDLRCCEGTELDDPIAESSVEVD